MLALQKALDVGRNLLPLSGELLASGQLLGRRDQIAAGTFRNIHARVGDADDVFDGEAVGGETGHAETAGDVVLAQHRVRGNPLPQALGQHLGLLRAGFGHEDDEFVSAIARHHVRLPGFLLQQTSHASQHQVAFEVAHGVVYFLEFVQVNQHNGEGPSRARSALPLR